MYAQVGECFEQTIQLNIKSVSEFARLCGDFNPLHSDPVVAARSRFQGLIACGPQYASMFMGMAATHFAAKGLTLGLEFTFRFRVAVRSDDTLRFRWEVTAVTWNDKLAGDVVSLAGSITNAAGEEVLSSTGKMLVSAPL
ncbi:MAG TPA: MaoC family dehydratase [Pirellulales bacterium]|jgi:acyl dehydratase